MHHACAADSREWLTPIMLERRAHLRLKTLKSGKVVRLSLLVASCEKLYLLWHCAPYPCHCRAQHKGLRQPRDMDGLPLE
jgi:hypothetical protein